MWWHVLASKHIKQKWTALNEVDLSTVRVGDGDVYLSVTGTTTRLLSLGSDAATGDEQEVNKLPS